MAEYLDGMRPGRPRYGEPLRPNSASQYSGEGEMLAPLASTQGDRPFAGRSSSSILRCLVQDQASAHHPTQDIAGGLMHAEVVACPEDFEHAAGVVEVVVE